MCGKGPGQGHGWVVGGTRGWAGGSGSSVGTGTHHTSWRVMHRSCWRTIRHERDDGGRGSTNRRVRDMRMRGRGKGAPWALAVGILSGDVMLYRRPSTGSVSNRALNPQT